MGRQKTLSITQLPAWTEAAAVDFERIAAASSDDFANWQAHIETGVFTLSRIDLEGASIGHLIWSIEHEPSRRALIVNAVGAKPVSGICIADQIHRFATAMAKQNDCQVLRFWTQREGLRRVMQDQFKTTYVMERTL